MPRASSSSAARATCRCASSSIRWASSRRPARRAPAPRPRAARAETSSRAGAAPARMPASGNGCSMSYRRNSWRPAAARRSPALRCCCRARRAASAGGRSSLADREGSMKRTTRYALVAGFTLIELMITVAVIAILGGIAYPSYQAYIRRAARAEARAAILDIAQKQERYFSSNNGYLAIAAPTTAAPTGWQNFTGGTSMAARKYNISVAVVGGTSYTITAAPGLAARADQAHRAPRHDARGGRGLLARAGIPRRVLPALLQGARVRGAAVAAHRLALLLVRRPAAAQPARRLLAHGPHRHRARRAGRPRGAVATCARLGGEGLLPAAHARVPRAERRMDALRRAEPLAQRLAVRVRGRVPPDVHHRPRFLRHRLHAVAARDRLAHALGRADALRLAGDARVLRAVLEPDQRGVSQLRERPLMDGAARWQARARLDLGRRDHRSPLRLLVVDGGVRPALLQPHPPRHHHQRPLPLAAPSRVLLQVAVVVADRRAVRAAAGKHPGGGAPLGTALAAERRVRAARVDRGAPPAARPRLCALRRMDRPAWARRAASAPSARGKLRPPQNAGVAQLLEQLIRNR